MHRILSITRTVLIAFLLLSLAACSGHRGNTTLSDSATTELDSWLDTQLLPYLSKRLSTYPRFKNQAVYLAIMDKAEVRSAVDPLSISIRERIQNRLISVPGIKLTWQSKEPGYVSDTTVDPRNCQTNDKPVYYIAIDLHPTPFTDVFALDVKALNLAENRWLDGFGMSWQGPLSSPQQRLFAQKVLDPALKGTRAYPFVRSEPDLTATYLAETIGCQLRKLTKTHLIITIDDNESDEFLRTVGRLMYSSLGRIKELTVTENGNKANVIIKLRAEKITNDLFQILASGQYIDETSSLLGAEAATYVTLGSISSSINNRNQPSSNIQIGTAEPVFTSPDPQTSDTRVSYSVLPLQLPARIHVVQPATSLIDEFSLLVPYSTELCRTNSPWEFGARRMGDGEQLDNSDCLALDLTTVQPATVFFFTHDENGTLTLLADSRREGLMQLIPGLHFQFPSLKSESILDVTGGPGIESIYAIASTDIDLNGQIGEFVSAGSIRPTEFQAWLKQMKNRYANSFDWQQITYNHSPIHRNIL